MGGFKLIRYLRNPQGGEYVPVDTFISNVQELVRELNRLIGGKPTFVELLAPNQDVMVIGIGGPVATVGFGTLEMQREGRQIGVAGTVGDGSPEWVEFDASGTPSPVSRDALIGADEMVEIARRFLETRELHPDFTWE